MASRTSWASKNEGVKLKRIGKKDNIIAEIVQEEHLNYAIDQVLDTKKRRNSPGGRKILRNRKKVVERLKKEISEGTFMLHGYSEREVKDGPKNRKVQCTCLYDRIGLYAIMDVVERHVKRKYITTTAASIKGRGMHYLLNALRKDIREDPEGMWFFYKNDIQKFYESTIQDIMMDALRMIFRDRILLTMLERFVRMMPTGLSIGLRSSQGFGNMLLSVFLDHRLKDQMGVKHYYRYCDDGDAHAKTKRECWKIRDAQHQYVAEAKLKIKPNEAVRPLSEGVDFLGYVIYPDHTRLRKRNKQNAARKLHKVKSRKRRVEIVGSLYGQCKHGDCRNLFRTLTGMSMEEYKRLKDYKLKPQYPDGKKRFNVKEINMGDLLREEFLVVDFETGIVTAPQKKDYQKKVDAASRAMQRYIDEGVSIPANFKRPEAIEMPEGKHIVLLKRSNGEYRKFYTGDRENWSILEQMRKLGLPMYSSIKEVPTKYGVRYVFDY